jgi:hypothetical protein
VTSKRNQLRKSAVKQMKAKRSLVKDNREGRIARAEMVTGLEEVEQKRMMSFIDRVL